MKSELIEKSSETYINQENLINKSLNTEEEEKKISLINSEQEKRRKEKKENKENKENKERRVNYQISSSNNIDEKKSPEKNIKEEKEKKMKIKLFEKEMISSKEKNEINKKEKVSKKLKIIIIKTKKKKENIKSRALKKLSKLEINMNNNNSYEINKTQELNNNIKILKSERINNLSLKKKVKNLKSKIIILPPIKNLQNEKNSKLTYCIYKGNNDKLIEKCFKYRKEIWQKSEYPLSKYCDLLWTPLSKDIDFKMLENKKQYVNHLEYHDEITNKRNLYLTLLNYCENKHYNLFNFFPFTIIFELKHKTLETQLNQFKYLYDNIDNYVYGINNDLFYHKYNEIFYTYQSKKLGSEQRIFFPKTHYEGYNLWLIKAINLNRGMGIKVENDLDKIEKEIIEINDNLKMEISNKKKRKCKCILIQKYIEKPLLYQGRKFDIRLWVLFIGNKPDDVYIFKEGHLKATCGNYDLNSKDLFIHLTNYSIQKYNSDFSKIEIGNEIPFKDLQKDLDSKKIKINFRNNIYPKIVRIVRITAGAAKDKINRMKRKNCFEIYGYDFMIDDNYNPFLIEINTNPGFEISSPLIDMLLPRLIDDAFKLTIDTDFYLSNIYINSPSNFPVEGYSNNENMFEKYSVL